MEITECKEVLSTSDSGNLAVLDGDKPYQVPVSYAYFDEKIYLHSAPEGRIRFEFSLVSAMFAPKAETGISRGAFCGSGGSFKGPTWRNRQ